ncbi:MAG TPA: DNA ligase D [Noviherbaspirillum sp.]
MPDKLSTYHARRNFAITPEPRGDIVGPSGHLRFVVQKHHARKLHYDFRLELDGTLKSWAVPKGPSLDPAEKRLAVHVEDHPLDYIDFEGDIPERQYGAGHVDVWDIGTWEPQGDPLAGYRAGKLKFRLDGEKLHGGWTLVRTRLSGGSKEQWLLIKEKDEDARPHREIDITEAMPHSVLRGPADGAGARGATRKTDDAAVGTRKPPKGRGSRREKKQVDASLDPTALTNARRASVPATMTPQLATLVDAAPASGDWLYEIKFDGYRILARIEGGDVALLTRDGKDWTARMPAQVEAIAALGIDSAWLDGEIVVLDKDGVPSFQLLQQSFDEKRAAQILYFLFDLPYLNGYDLRAAPLVERRALLERLLAGVRSEVLRYSAPMQQAPQQLLDSACRMSMEGLIGKRADAPYLGKRSDTWIKLKCRRRQEFVIGGYTEPQGSRKYVGALLLGVYDNGTLRYAGRVGTGFDRATLHAVYRQLAPLKQRNSPFVGIPAGMRRAETHWVKPQLVAEVSFSEWTSDGMLRQAVFHGLRSDKPATDIRREEAASAPGKRRVQNTQAPDVVPIETPDAAQLHGIRISNPDRVIDPEGGFTKLDLARYYERIAEHILPYLRNRPVYLLRAPEGIEGERFFQKHSTRMSIPGVRTLDPSLDPGHAPLMTIDSPHALVGAAQMGNVELHTPNATADRIDRPDCMVFDLDPDPALPWEKVVEGAQLTKVVLDELQLQSFLKTSGGKGLHLVVPLARRNTWDDVAKFSQGVAQHLARMLPKHFSAKMGEKNRVGRIFVDHLRNREHASTVAPYSARARPGLPVAVPIAWEELTGIKNAAMWRIDSLPGRLSGLGADPWEGYFALRQSITAAMRRKLGV